MNLEFLIATTNRKDISFLDDLFKYIGLEHINAVVINQLTNGMSMPTIPSPHKGIRVFSVYETGLSKSRNRALHHSKGDVLVLADDDAVYTQDALEIVKKYHLKYPNDDVITFQVVGLNKQYPMSSHLHNKRSVMKISSLEITLKRTVVENNFSFDERFGLGATYPIAEENIWLRDIIWSKKKAIFIPANIVTHQGVSTGQKYSAAIEKARGAAFLRIYGWLGIPISLWFAIKKYKKFSQQHSLLTEAYYLFTGLFSFAFSPKRKQ